MKKIAIVAVVLIAVYLLINKAGIKIINPLQAAPNDPNLASTAGVNTPLIASGSLGVPLPVAPVLVVNAGFDDWAPVSETGGFISPPIGSITVNSEG